MAQDLTKPLSLPQKDSIDCFANREYLLNLLLAPEGYIGKMNHCDKAAAKGGAFAMFALLAPHADLLVAMALDISEQAKFNAQDAAEDVRTINRILDKYRD